MSDTLAEAIESAITELRQMHAPVDVRLPNTKPRPDARLGCVVCWPTDSDWPCIVAMVAQDLADALQEAR